MPTRWLHHHYPTWDDLLAMADTFGIRVVEHPSPRPCCLPPDEGGPAILVPSGLSTLERFWALAHELGHALRHSGPIPLLHSRQEFQASHWAACALIPEARIRHHANASEDAFIAALSANYEDIPYKDCSTRRLAARIARYRLEAMTGPDHAPA